MNTTRKQKQRAGWPPSPSNKWFKERKRRKSTHTHTHTHTDRQTTVLRNSGIAKPPRPPVICPLHNMHIHKFATGNWSLITHTHTHTERYRASRLECFHPILLVGKLQHIKKKDVGRWGLSASTDSAHTVIKKKLNSNLWKKKIVCNNIYKIDTHS